jgi:hypothetical protein
MVSAIVSSHWSQEIILSMVQYHIKVQTKYYQPAYLPVGTYLISLFLDVSEEEARGDYE